MSLQWDDRRQNNKCNCWFRTKNAWPIFSMSLYSAKIKIRDKTQVMLTCAAFLPQKTIHPDAVNHDISIFAEVVIVFTDYVTQTFISRVWINGSVVILCHQTFANVQTELLLPFPNIFICTSDSSVIFTLFTIGAYHSFTNHSNKLKKIMFMRCTYRFVRTGRLIQESGAVMGL